MENNGTPNILTIKLSNWEATHQEVYLFNIPGWIVHIALLRCYLVLKLFSQTAKINTLRALNII